MASKLSLRNELRKYIVTDIQETGRAIGKGAYGEVVEMIMGERSVAGKRIHPILLETGNEGTEVQIQRFKEECIRYIHKF